MKISRKYSKPGLSYLEVEVGSQILAGSVKSIDVSNVTVTDYSKGFEDGADDFKDISFD